MDLTEDEFNFIAAVIEDENYEYFLDDDEEYSLFTDWEGDGYFMPSVTIMHSVEDEGVEQQIVTDLLEDVDWLNNSYVDIETDGDTMGHAYFEPSSIDSDVREQVADQL